MVREGEGDEAGAIPQAGGAARGSWRQATRSKGISPPSPLPFCSSIPPSPLNHTRNPQPHDAFARGSRIDHRRFGASPQHPQRRIPIDLRVAPSPPESPAAVHHARCIFSSRLSPLCAVCSVQGCDPKVLQDGSSVSPAPPPSLLHRVRPPPPSFAFAFARPGVAKAITHRLATHFKSVECALRWCPAFRNRISLHWLSFSRRVFPRRMAVALTRPASNQIVPGARRIRHPIQVGCRKGIGAIAVINPEKPCSTRAFRPRPFSTTPRPGLCPQILYARSRLGHRPPRQYRSQCDVGAAVRLGLVIGCSRDNRRKHGRRSRAASHQPRGHTG